MSIVIGGRRLDRARLGVWLAAGVWVLGVLALFLRLPYGSAIRDEAYYAALPYSFAIGNQPFVDELAVPQTTGILLLPMVRAYLAVNGSTDGLILFLRYLYFGYALACSVLAYRLSRRIVGSAWACVAAAFIVTFSYFNLFALSYNTCGAFGVFCGIALSARALLAPRPGLRLFVASLFFLSAMFTYPGSAPAVFVSLVVVSLRLWRSASSEQRRSGLWGIGAGGLFAVGFALAVVGWLGRENIANVMAFTRSSGYGLAPFARFGPFDFVHSVAWPWRWLLLGFACLFLLAPFALRARQWAWLAAPVIVATFALLYQHSTSLLQPSPAAIYLAVVFVLAPTCLALNRGWQHASLVFWVIWLPSFVSMWCVVYTSNNNYWAASLGALGALLAGVLASIAAYRAQCERQPAQRAAVSAAFAALLGSLFVTHVHSLYGRIYDDKAPFSALTTRVTRGPLRGTYGTPAEVGLVESFDADLKSLAPEAKTVAIFDDFPIGYLSTRLAPRMFTVWAFWGLGREYTEALLARTFDRPERMPDLLVEFRSSARGRRYWKRYFKSGYRPVIRRPEHGYVISKRIGEPVKP